MLMCPTCSRPFSSRSGLKKHVELAHFCYYKRGYNVAIPQYELEVVLARRRGGQAHRRVRSPSHESRRVRRVRSPREVDRERENSTGHRGRRERRSKSPARAHTPCRDRPTSTWTPLSGRYSPVRESVPLETPDETIGIPSPFAYFRRGKSRRMNPEQPSSELNTPEERAPITDPSVPEVESGDSWNSFGRPLFGTDVFSLGVAPLVVSGVDVAVEAHLEPSLQERAVWLENNSVATSTQVTLMDASTGTTVMDELVPLPEQFSLDGVCRTILALPELTELQIIQHLTEVVAFPALIGPDRALVETVTRSILAYERLLFGRLREIVISTRLTDPTGCSTVEECAAFLDKFRRPK